MRIISKIVLLVIFAFFACTEKNSDKQNLKQALSFYASFDKAVKADFSLGDANLYTVRSRKPLDSAEVGLNKPGISWKEDKGKYSGGLLFTEKSRGDIFYKSENNISYNKTNWSGAISFWLSLDPNTDLKPGFCDPIQITDTGYNDAAIWVDFTKENPRDFRLGVIEDRNAWNPNPEGPDNVNPKFIELLPAVKNPPFAKGKWTHILINFSGLNTENGEASLYMDGELKGTRNNFNNPFTWEVEKSNIFLGLSYIGLMDDLSIYNRALTISEINTLYNLENGVIEILE